jgi:hypothetical protein
MAGGLIDDTIDHKPAAYRPEVTFLFTAMKTDG